ncbi:MAG: hypothetical protein P8076_12320 [Gammaproteobacteria bacterium]
MADSLAGVIVAGAIRLLPITTLPLQEIPQALETPAQRQPRGRLVTVVAAQTNPAPLSRSNVLC